MNDKHIVLLGCGALGSHIMLFGRNLEADWRVVDDDFVEQRNVASQFHVKQHVRKNKAQALQMTMRGFFDLKNIEAIPHRFTDVNADTLLQEASIVLDAFDHGASRRLAQAVCNRLGVPLLHAALAADGMFGRVVWSERFIVDDETVIGQATCEDGRHLPFITRVASCAAEALKAFLTDGTKRDYPVVVPTRS